MIYDFDIVIGFRCEADNEHDALQHMLDAENSLNEASLRSYGLHTMRVKPPTYSRFRKSKYLMPDEPVDRDIETVNERYRKLLAPLKKQWTVVLDDGLGYGKSYQYLVTKPTEQQAIAEAKLRCYHKHGHLTPTVLSVHQEKVRHNA